MNLADVRRGIVFEDSSERNLGDKVRIDLRTPNSKDFLDWNKKDLYIDPRTELENTLKKSIVEPKENKFLVLKVGRTKKITKIDRKIIRFVRGGSVFNKKGIEAGMVER